LTEREEIPRQRSSSGCGMRGRDQKVRKEKTYLQEWMKRTIRLRIVEDGRSAVTDARVNARMLFASLAAILSSVKICSA